MDFNADLKEKIKIAKEVVSDQEEPFRTEGFKVILTQLIAANSSEQILTTKKIQAQKTLQPKTFSFSGVSKGIYALLIENFFSVPRFLKDVKAELEKNTFYYDVRAIDKSLRVVFVKNNQLLTRVKNESKWAYVIKK